MREMFLSRLVELVEKDSVSCEVLSKQTFNQIINNVKKAKSKVFRDPGDNVLLQKYNVIIEDNIEKLVKPSVFNHHKYYTYDDQLYDIIYSMHIETGHGGLTKLLPLIQSKYVAIPVPVIQLCLSLCQVCKSQKNLMHDDDFVKQESGQRIRVTQQDNWLSHYSKSPHDDTQTPNPGPEKSITVIDLSDDEDDIPDNRPANQDTMADCNNKSSDDIDKQKSVEEIAICDTIENKINSNPVLPLPSSSSTVPNPPSPRNQESQTLSVSSGTSGREQATSTQQPIESHPIVHNVDDDDDDDNDVEISQPTEVSLHWNLYDSNMKSVLSSFLYEERFVDVTLTCEDESINCHKVILSASSPYFEKLFRQNPSRHPIVLLKELHFWEVQALVEFIYKGEVKVPRCKLELLLDAAEILQIKGLAKPVDKMSTKNCQLRKKFLKRRSIKNSNLEQKYLSVKNGRHVNNKKLSLKGTVEKLESSTQTLPDSVTFINNNNSIASFPSGIQSQNTDHNAFTVFTQTYPSFGKAGGPQNLISINNPCSTFSHLSHPSISGTETPCRVLVSQMPFSPVTLPEVPRGSISSLHKNCQNHSPINSFTVSCTSSTQTSPRREDANDDSDSPPISNSPPKKQKVVVTQKRNNHELTPDNNDSLNIDDMCNNDKSNSKAVKKNKHSIKRNDNTIDDKINSLMSRGDTNVIFTRKKTADMESIANRTRKKQSKIVKKKKPVYVN